MRSLNKWHVLTDIHCIVLYQSTSWPIIKIFFLQFATLQCYHSWAGPTRTFFISLNLNYRFSSTQIVCHSVTIFILFCLRRWRSINAGWPTALVVFLLPIPPIPHPILSLSSDCLNCTPLPEGFHRIGNPFPSLFTSQRWDFERGTFVVSFFCPFLIILCDEQDYSPLLWGRICSLCDINYESSQLKTFPAPKYPRGALHLQKQRSLL